MATHVYETLRDNAIRAAKPGDILRERCTKYLQLRVTDAGSRVWQLKYRSRRTGTTRSMGGFGTFPEVTIAEARRLTLPARRQIEDGIDPIDQRRVADAKAMKVAHQVIVEVEQEQQRDLTFRQVADLYLERYASQVHARYRHTAVAVNAICGVRLADGRQFGDIPALEVTKGVVQLLIQAMLRTPSQRAEQFHGEPEAPLAPHTAKQRAVLVGSIWHWATGLSDIKALEDWKKPLAGLRLGAKFPYQPRDRVLADHELVAIVKAARQIRWPCGPVIELMAYTGLRGGEVESLCWRPRPGRGYFDPDANQLVFPAGSTKDRRRKFVVFLSRQARRVLDSLPRTVGIDYVFGASNRPPAWSRRIAKELIDPVAQIGDWRPHDLRRTCASGLQKLGYSVDLIKAVLNHSMTSGATLAYLHHDFRDEKAAAWQRWADHVDKLVAASEIRLLPPPQESHDEAA
ncbi:MAG: integrase arm-type DNA-binding domain-containing protein [Chromatiales bacterium]|nr:integrase arm-type DNA-binding domain-containing protein [Chromatiales bacterium]